MISLVLVEDHVAIAEGLAALVGCEPDIEVRGVANDRTGAERLIAAIVPDVVLCDVMLDETDAGFDLLARFGERSRFLMYSAYGYQAHHARALDGGARGFISKMADAKQIVQAVRRVARGGEAYPADVRSSAQSAPRRPTEREIQLLSLLADGASNDGIGESMGLRPKTVEGMISRLFDRYGMSNRTHLAGFAARQGWLTSNRRGSEKIAAR